MGERGHWDENEGWIGAPLRWAARGFWCKLNLHRWGAPWCMECGEPDEILQEAIREQFDALRRAATKGPTNDR